MSMGVAWPADIRPPEHAASRKELPQRALGGCIGDMGVNRQAPDAHGREVPSQKGTIASAHSRALRGLWWTLVLSWRLGVAGVWRGGGGAGWRAPRRATQAIHLAHEVRDGGRRGRAGLCGVTSVDSVRCHEVKVGPARAGLCGVTSADSVCSPGRLQAARWTSSAPAPGVGMGAARVWVDACDGDLTSTSRSLLRIRKRLTQTWTWTRSRVAVGPDRSTPGRRTATGPADSSFNGPGPVRSHNPRTDMASIGTDVKRPTRRVVTLQYEVHVGGGHVAAYGIQIGLGDRPRIGRETNLDPTDM